MTHNLVAVRGRDGQDVTWNGNVLKYSGIVEGQVKGWSIVIDVGDVDEDGGFGVEWTGTEGVVGYHC